MTDKIFRTWHLLRLLPRHPRRKTPSELQKALKDAGFELTLRSVQRDLNSLSSLWGITCDTEGTTNYWYWPPNAKLLDIPNLGSAEALVFMLAKEYLRELLPVSQLEVLQPYFDRAGELVQGEQVPASRWHKRVRVIHQGPALKTPDVPGAVLLEVHEALLHDRKVLLTYRPRGGNQDREYLLSPQALVIRQGVIYLLATLGRHEDLTHFALHRASQAQATDQRATKLKAFDLDRYLEAEKGFSYPRSKEDKLRLRARVSEQLAFHLTERPLGEDQLIEAITPSNIKLSVSVQDTEDLRWWILGMGDSISVTEPAALRKEIKTRLQSTLKSYS